MNFSAQDVITMVTEDWNLGAEVICNGSDDEFDADDKELDEELNEYENDTAIEELNTDENDTAIDENES